MGRAAVEPRNVIRNVEFIDWEQNNRHQKLPLRWLGQEPQCLSAWKLSSWYSSTPLKLITSELIDLLDRNLVLDSSVFYYRLRTLGFSSMALVCLFRSRSEPPQVLIGQEMMTRADAIAPSDAWSFELMAWFQVPQGQVSRKPTNQFAPLGPCALSATATGRET